MLHARAESLHLSSSCQLRSSRSANKTYVDIRMTIIVREGPRTSDYLSGEPANSAFRLRERDGEDHLVYLRVLSRWKIFSVERKYFFMTAVL